MNRDYPIYLKYPNEKIFIKILNDREWEEVRFLGSKKSIKSFKAEIFTDKVYIDDIMSYLDQGLLTVIESGEYYRQRDEL